MVSGQGATATVWTPDLLQTLAQGRQVTIFTNKGIGYSTDTQHEASSVAGLDLKLLYHISTVLGIHLHYASAKMHLRNITLMMVL